MKLSEITDPNLIIMDLKGVERWSVIEEMVDWLVQQKCMDQSNRESVVQKVKKREKDMSTGIGFGVAIPHADTDAISKVTAVIARSSKGVNFDSLDAQPVKLVVLFLVPLGQYPLHLRTLAIISRTLQDRLFREHADGVKTAEEFYQLIVKRES
ncbi:MAG: PTS sugar transporter subunit IIA [Verrucomicrobiae bacterium]|nr:PTS sugar transporter subunit IIA [Verrucomicrobiae bacterium]